MLEVGVCGTDREISEGHFGVPPEGEATLVLGHELLGLVERDGQGFARGDLVTAVVRRSCSHCGACEEGSPDSCLTGDYHERGITRLHGFARELVAEDPTQLIAIPRSLGRLGVLAEPASICARGDTPRAGDRQPAAVGAPASARARSRGDRNALDLPAPARRSRGLDCVPRSEHRQPRRARCRLRRALRLAPAKRLCRTPARTSAASTSSWRRQATPRSWPTASACSVATALPACSGSTPVHGRSSSTDTCSVSTRSSRTASSSAA